MVGPTWYGQYSMSKPKSREANGASHALFLSQLQGQEKYSGGKFQASKRKCYLVHLPPHTHTYSNALTVYKMTSVPIWKVKFFSGFPLGYLVMFNDFLHISPKDFQLIFMGLFLQFLFPLRMSFLVVLCTMQLYFYISSQSLCPLLLLQSNHYLNI